MQFVQEQVVRIFQTCLSKAVDGANLSTIIDAYNQQIKLNAALKDWELKIADDSWQRDVGHDDVVFQQNEAVQTNVEVPFLKIGSASDTSIPALIHTAAEKDRFLKCRTAGNKIVDSDLRPIAYQLHGKLFKLETIKLDKLRSFLTLHLFSTVTLATMAPDNTRNPKMLFDFLPKVGGTSVIMNTLSLRDRAVLDLALKGGLESKLLAEAKTIVNNNEKFQEDKTKQRISEVFTSTDKGTGTPAGKPLDPRVMEIVRGGQKALRHMAVFEIRATADPVNAMYTAVKQSANDISSTNPHGLLLEAQKPLPPRVTKTRA
jgi:hypothetical protein